MSEVRSVTDGERVTVVGIGDDGPASLTARALDVVRGAELLCGGRRHLDFFPEHPAERVVITGDLEAFFRQLESEVGRRRVVVLASGDPCFFGIGPLVRVRLGHDRVEIIPNVGAVSLAFARLGLSWHDATVVSAHGRPLDDALRAARGAGKLIILTDEQNTPAAIARGLLERGALDAEGWVFEHVGGSAERAFHGMLSEVADRSFAALNTLVIPALDWPEIDQRFGLAESSYAHRQGLITKAEVRAVSLSKLRLRRDDTLWDIGAGCGSVAIEAAGLLPRGQVYAVERSTEQLGLLRRNVASAGRAGYVKVVEGEAPEVLRDLPAPAAVFVGGSGGRLESILDDGYGALRPGGRLVVNLATIDHLTACSDWSRRRQVSCEVVQLSVARGSEILGMTRLEAQNPVFIVAFERAP